MSCIPQANPMKWVKLDSADDETERYKVNSLVQGHKMIR